MMMMTLGSMATAVWPDLDEEDFSRAEHRLSHHHQQQQAGHGATGLLLERWHVQVLLESARDASLIGQMQTLLLLWNLSFSIVDHALLLGPYRGTLSKMVSLPRSLSQVEWRVAAPEGGQGSVFANMVPYIDAADDMMPFHDSISDQVHAAAAVVRMQRLPKAWRELREALVCFAQAALRLDAYRTAANNAGSFEDHPHGDGAGYGVLRQQRASACEALAASSRVHCNLLQQLPEC
jgi:hypothetical protein